MAGRVSGYVWRNSKHKGSTLLVLLALAECAHPDGDGAYPSLAMLSEMTKLSERAVRYCLRQIEANGEARVSMNASPRGTNVWLIPMPEEGAKIAPVQTLQGATQRTRGGQPTVARGAIAVAPEPSVTVTRTVKVAAASPQPFEVRTPAAEEKATAHEADVLWVAERSRKGIDRFTDPKARANLRLSAKRALRHGVWQDIKDAILVHAPNPDANPWYLDEWTRVAAGQRREVETLQRKMAERARDDSELRRHYARGAPKHISQFIPAVISDASA